MSMTANRPLPTRGRPYAPPLSAAERAARRAARQARSTWIMNGMALFLPMAMGLQVEAIGRLYVAEFLMLLVLPMLVIDRGGMLMAALPKTVLILAAAWLGGQIVTDLVNGTPYADYSRGWARIVFFLLAFSVTYMLVYGNRRRIVLFAIGLSIGYMASLYLYPSEAILADPWKFGYGIPVTTLGVVLALSPLFRRVSVFPVAILGALGVLNMVLGLRSLAGVCFMTALYLVAQLIFGKKGEKVTPPTNVRLVFMLIVGIAAVWAVIAAYEYAALEGLLGDDARDKYIDQTAEGYGVLLGGRHELLVSAQAIADSPILGHGSWAKDPLYAEMLMAMTRSPDEALEAAWFGDLIPTHSYLTGSWVEAGILGGVFWIFVLFLVTKVLANLFQARDALSPLYVFLALQLVWDVLFSPFGADRRIMAGYQIALMIFAWEGLKGYAERAKQIRRIRRAARKALKPRLGGPPRGGAQRPLPNPRLMRRPPPNVATLPRPSARAAQRAETASTADEDAPGHSGAS